MQGVLQSGVASGASSFARCMYRAKSGSPPHCLTSTGTLISAFGVTWENWAIQGSNPEQKPQQNCTIRGVGAAKSAAHSGETPQYHAITPIQPDVEKRRHSRASAGRSQVKAAATARPDATKPASSESNEAGNHFAEAVAAIMRLPLSDAEKAEAVRRLLAQEELQTKSATA